MWLSIISFLGGPVVKGLIEGYKAKLAAAGIKPGEWHPRDTFTNALDPDGKRKPTTVSGGKRTGGGGEKSGLLPMAELIDGGHAEAKTEGGKVMVRLKPDAVPDAKPTPADTDMGLDAMDPQAASGAKPIEQHVHDIIKDHYDAKGYGIQFDALKKELDKTHPGMTTAQFHDALKHLQKNNHAMLTNWEKTRQEIPDQSLAIDQSLSKNETARDLKYHAEPVSRSMGAKVDVTPMATRNPIDSTPDAGSAVSDKAKRQLGHIRESYEANGTEGQAKADQVRQEGGDAGKQSPTNAGTGIDGNRQTSDTASVGTQSADPKREGGKMEVSPFEAHKNDPKSLAAAHGETDQYAESHGQHALRILDPEYLIPKNKAKYALLMQGRQAELPIPGRFKGTRPYSPPAISPTVRAAAREALKKLGIADPVVYTTASGQTGVGDRADVTKGWVPVGTEQKDTRERETQAGYEVGVRRSHGADVGDLVADGVVKDVRTVGGVTYAKLSRHTPETRRQYEQEVASAKRAKDETAKRVADALDRA